MRQNTSQKVRDIYKLDKQIDRIWNQIKNELSEENHDIILKYETQMINAGLAKATRIKHLKIMLSLSRLINKNWSDVIRDDISRVIKQIMSQYGDVNGDETESSRDFKKILKIFFRWYKLGSRDFNEVGDPPELKGIKLRKPKDKLTRENLLTKDDMTRLLHACGENQRDRAFLDVHYEAGTRPGEILSLQLKHVEFDKYGARIHVDGKTGARPIRIIQSTPNLATWINSHPMRNNSDAPLWILLDADNYGKPMTYTAAKEMLSRRCRIAHLSKRVNLKLFRHSEATNTAKFLTDSEMRTRHGWTRASNMASRYVHLNDTDVEEKILSQYGIIPKNEAHAQKPKVCHICEMPNSPDSHMCSKCGKALDLETALEKDEERELQKDELSRISQAVSNLVKEREQEKQLHQDEISRQRQLLESLARELAELKQKKSSRQ